MGDFKSEIEEQKKVHLCVDMTNISPPSKKNVPLQVSSFSSLIHLKGGGDMLSGHENVNLSVKT